MKNKRAYACGPMAGCSDGEMIDWRRKFISLWDGECGDPSGRDYRNVWFNMNQNRDLAANVVNDDLEDIDKCDALVMYFPFISVGSTCEVFYAKHIRKIPVVIINASGSEFLSPWLVHHADAIVDTVEESIVALDRLLTQPKICPTCNGNRGYETRFWEDSYMFHPCLTCDGVGTVKN